MAVTKEQAFDTLATHIFKWEGGYVVNPTEDYATNKGVTYITYKALCKKLLNREPTPEHFKKLTDWEAKVFIREFWNSVGADKIKSPSIAAWVTEMAWGSGPAIAIRTVQQVLNTSFGYKLTVDGKIGAKTLAAINAAPESRLFDALGVARKKFLTELTTKRPEKKIFLQGWFNRVNDFIKKKTNLVR